MAKNSGKAGGGLQKSELAIIDKMRSPQNEGFSYWKIADILNAMKVPTKTRKGKWHARSIPQILDYKKPRW